MSDTSIGSSGRVRKTPKFVLTLDRLPYLSEHEKNRLRKVCLTYPFRANDYYLSLIDWNDPYDPLRRVVIPDESELDRWGALDASAEHGVTVRKGIQHKYRHVVLLLVYEVCASFCRYCFRKRLFMNGSDEALYNVEAGVRYIRNHPEVNNVLLTGGDPMILSTARLERILSDLDAIDHLRLIRIGSKLPAFNPYRFFDDALISLFRRYSRPERRIYMMCHFDHPRELTCQSREAIARLISAGVICVNQNPIVRGISDDPNVMAELWNELSFMGVDQYYVFQCRPTAGNRSFAVPLVEAYHRIEEAKKKCAGLAKRLRFAMSHESGKIETVGVDRRHIYLKYHRARHQKDEQRFMICHRDDSAFWFDQLRPIDVPENRFRDERRDRPGYL